MSIYLDTYILDDTTFYQKDFFMCILLYEIISRRTKNGRNQVSIT